MSDLFYLLVVTLLCISSQLWINHEYNKYSNVEVSNGKNGVEIVNGMMGRYNLHGLRINMIRGKLTDHYNSQDKSINLSMDNYNKPSIASIAVAAHEMGHAIQDNKGYLFLKLRKWLGPITIISSRISWVFIYLGFVIGYLPIIWMGIILVGIVLLFDLVTLPVELNASKSAKDYLVSTGEFNKEELEGVSKVLTAAAFTYLASTLAGALQLIRLISYADRD